MRNHPEISKDAALKFNLGRKFVPERVEDCFRNYQKTVMEHHFENITVADVLDELRTQKLYIPGTRDRNGAALFIINAAKHVPGQFSNEQTLKLGFYMGELLAASPKTSRIGVTIISNMDGLEWANFDNQFQRNIIAFFQNNIPIRVKNIILYKSPWWVSMLVRMVSPFLKQKMRQRIHICDEGDLLQFAEPDQLPEDLGGMFEYDHEVFLKKEIAKVPSAAILSVASEPTEGTTREITQAPPPGTVMLVTDELAQKLNEERQRVLAELDEKIRRRRESLKQHSLPLDISKILRSRSTRMSLDLSVIPSLEPNLLHLRDARVEGQPSLLISTNNSPIAEQPCEDYDPDILESRIRKSIMKDRSSFLKKMRRHAAISGVSSVHEHEVEGGERENEENTSEDSFIPPEEEGGASPNPTLMPTLKERFSVSTAISPVPDANGKDSSKESTMEKTRGTAERETSVRENKREAGANEPTVPQKTEDGEEKETVKLRRPLRRSINRLNHRRTRPMVFNSTLDDEMPKAQQQT